MAAACRHDWKGRPLCRPFCVSARCLRNSRQVAVVPEADVRQKRHRTGHGRKNAEEWLGREDSDLSLQVSVK